MKVSKSTQKSSLAFLEYSDSNWKFAPHKRCFRSCVSRSVVHEANRLAAASSYVCSRNDVL